VGETAFLDVHPRSSPDLARIFGEQGVVLVGDVLTLEEAEELKGHVERYRRLALPAVPEDWVRYEPDGSVRGMYYLDRVDPFFESFGRRDDLRELVERVTGKRARFSSIDTFDKPATVGSPSLAHQDGIYFAETDVEIQNLWIPIDPSHVENGALQYWPGTHTCGYLPHVPAPDDPYLKMLDPSVLEELGPPAVAELEPGGGAIHSELIVHASPPNLSTEPRRAMTVAYKLHLAAA
jgi:phytanoyl-CoA hydroxylase